MSDPLSKSYAVAATLAAAEDAHAHLFALASWWTARPGRNDAVFDILIKTTGALTAMLKAEPPSPKTAARLPMFRVGKDSRGHWVVQDQQGLRGGLFVDRAEAIKFAMFENGNRPQAVIMVPGILELEIGGGGSAARSAAADTQFSLRRVA